MNEHKPLIHVAAMTSDRLIGCDNDLPWDIPGELQDFRAFTKWKTVIMWRKTYEWLGRYLPHRRNILLTRSPEKVQVGKLETVREDGQWKCKGKKWEIEIYDSKDAVLKATKDDEDVLILWWAEIYKIFLDDSRSVLRISEISGSYEWDTYFPEFEDKYEVYDREEKEGFDVVWYRHIDQ